LYADGAAGTENQLWEPNRDADVGRLNMNASGGSVYSVYTRDVIDEVAVPFFGGNIYKGFLGMLDEMVDEEVIKDYQAFAYDWRYAVDDVVRFGTRYEYEIRNVVTAIERLAEDSYSGKVTVIGHSNGGLVAKVLISELERLGKADLVDKVVFIASPHLGTPKAIATLLHGYDQQKLGGVVIDDSTAREVMKNMPGVYGLLPSQRYLEITSEPIITISEGVSTQDMYDAFGGEIEGVTEYQNFLNGLEGRVDDFDDISNPYRANPQLLSRALSLHQSLDYWGAPEGIEVFNLVGVGLPTVSKIEYRNITERKNCTFTILGIMVCDTEYILRPYAHFTQYGDETVTSLSSETIDGETYYFDFAKYRLENREIFRHDHADITELEEVQYFVEEIIADTPSLTAYITETIPNFISDYEVTSIDSPVRVVKEDASGNKTGVVVNNGVAEIVKEIPGSEYVEFGGTKYVIVPKEDDMTTYLYGEDYGSYTLTTATLSGSEQVIDTQLVNATTTPTMVARYEFKNGTSSTILTDYEGDGVFEHEMTLTGEVIEELEITFGVLLSQIRDLGLSKSREKPLLLLVDLAEKTQLLKVHPKISKRISDRLLMRIRDTINLYTKKRWITQEQSISIQQTIKLLID
jgi:pimeloyl-ACP methyl ester carboxylesterase